MSAKHWPREATCCFTGHRAIAREEYPILGERLREEILRLYNYGYRHFISGSAVGFDTYAAMVVAGLKSECEDIRLHLAVPYSGHWARWSEADREYYRRLSRLCDTETVLSEHYHAGCYMHRNRWMVDRSSVCVAYYNGYPGGGTAGTVSYAAVSGIEIVNIFRCL